MGIQIRFAAVLLSAVPCLVNAQMSPMPPGALPPGINMGEMNRIYQEGQTGEISPSDAKLSCAEIDKEIRAFMQANQSQFEAVGKSAKEADQYQRKVLAEQDAKSKAESAATMALAAQDAATGTGGYALQAQHKAKAAEGAARQQESLKQRDDLLTKSATAVTSQPDQMIRMMQLNRVREAKNCPGPAVLDED